MRQVALLIESSGSYGRGLLDGVRRYVSEFGPWSLSFELRGLDSRPPGWLKRWKGDGILTRTGSQEQARVIAKLDIPVIELRTVRYSPSFPFVGVDNNALGKAVARYFLERGFRYFGVYRFDIEDYFVTRCDSFIEEVRSAGCQVEQIDAPEQIDDSRFWNSHQEHLVRWLRKLTKPVALMACNDQRGYWLLEACRRAGIAVPREAAVVGAENDETLCSMTSPPLSSIPYDARRIGYRAAGLLDQLMKGVATPEQPILMPPLEIVTRRSSDIVAIEDPLLAQAIQFIRNSACEGITVDDILRSVPISRSMLERKMRQSLGRSPHDEISRVRLELGVQLLKSTDLTLDHVALRCGFRTAQYFCTVFSKTFEMTPTQYRRENRI